MRKARITPSYVSLSPFLWLASFGTGFATTFLNTDWRDYEFGVSFIFYMLFLRYYYDEIHPRESKKAKFITAGLLILASLYTYSDPYFFYLTLLPLACWFAGLWILGKISLRKAIGPILFTFLALIFGRVLMSLFARVGIIAPKGALTITSLRNLHRSFDIFFASMGSIFGINFPKDSLISLGNITILTAISLILFKLRSIIRHSYQRVRSPGLAIKVFFSLLGIASIAAYIAIENSVGDTSRYLDLFVYVGALLIVLGMSEFGTRTLRTILTVLIVTAILNTSATISQLQNSHAAADSVNNSNYKLISTVEQLGFTKGYAGYWDSDINTYLSQNTVEFLPVTCSKSATVPLPLLVNGSLFSQLATKTFFVIDPTHTSPKLCSETQLYDQFGQPTGTIKVGKDTILLYNYDLYTKMTS